MDSIKIRPATQDDIVAITGFNQAMAFETEDIQLLTSVAERGVRSLVQNPALGFYLVAEIDGKVIASLMITTEWSDWRNGVFWWVQSVFVAPEFRRKGIYRRMYQFIKELASQKPDVCGFRLYVEKDNSQAQQTYTKLGMKQKPYLIFEEPKSES